MLSFERDHGHKQAQNQRRARKDVLVQGQEHQRAGRRRNEGADHQQKEKLVCVSEGRKVEKGEISQESRKDWGKG